MKQTLLTRLVLGAIAGIAAAGVANAGQITASSTNVAREVILLNSQSINSPTISYRFAGDLDATVQAQEFQVQFILEGGATWSNTPSDDAFSITPSTGTNSGLRGVGGTDFDVLAKGFDSTTNPTILFATIRVRTGAQGPWTTSLLDQPIVTLNGKAAGNVNPTTPATVSNLKTLVGDIADDYAKFAKCVDNKSLFVNFKHYKLLSNPSAIADASNGIEDEHTRQTATNRAGIVNFPTNLNEVVTVSTQGAILKPGGNMLFDKSSTAPGTSYVTDKIANLGKFTVVRNATGYDTDLTSVYALDKLTGTAAGAATNNDGKIEAEKISVAVTASQGFVAGGNLALSVNADCSAPFGAVATDGFQAQGAILTTTVPTASMATVVSSAATTKEVHICYTVPGANTIPSSSFSGVVTVNKASGTKSEQNNACGGPLYSLGGGLKIDVRNYASGNETSGWQSVIRFINNSDSSTADVWAQIIHQDGKLGGWGKLTDLTPRASINMTAKQIEAKLTNTATAAIGSNTTTAQPGTASTSDTAPRLRVTSQSGQSLRVQNYLYNPATGQIIEVSGSQGIDYEGNNLLRAPTNDGQYISQDANSGLNLAK